MRLGLLLVCGLVASCGTLDKPALTTFADIRAALDVKADQSSGAVTANSAPAARVATEFDHTLIGSMDETGLGSGAGGSTRSTQTMYVEGRRSADGGVAIEVVRVRGIRVHKDGLEQTPSERSGLDAEGRIGAKWRTVYRLPTRYEHDCQPDRPYCLRRVVDRLTLTDDDVRALLQESGDEIVVSFWYWRNVDWRLDKDELIAVLDALGVREQFQPAS